MGKVVFDKSIRGDKTETHKIKLPVRVIFHGMINNTARHLFTEGFKRHLFQSDG
jgi:hypothetical protein